MRSMLARMRARPGDGTHSPTCAPSLPVPPLTPLRSRPPSTCVCASPRSRKGFCAADTKSTTAAVTAAGAVAGEVTPTLQHAPPPLPPTWLPVPLPAVDPALQQLCDTLGIPESDAQMMVLLAPEVAALAPDDLSLRWSTLQRALPSPRGGAALARAVAADPALLLRPRTTVIARLRAAAAALRLARSQLVGPGGAALRFELATRPPAAALRRVALLADLLSIDAAAARRLLLAAPRLLGRRASAVQATADALEQVCQAALPRLAPLLLQVPAPLELSGDRIFAAATALQRDLRLSEQGLAVALRRAPAALAASPGQVGALVDALASRMAVAEEVAIDLLLQEPALLSSSPGGISSLLHSITTCFELDPPQLLQVVEFDPSALLMSPGALGARMRRFRALASSCPEWRREFRQLMSKPANVARALNLDATRLQRLAYLITTGRQALISLRAALTLSPSQFRRAYPRFDEWRATGRHDTRLGSGSGGGAGALGAEVRMRARRRGSRRGSGDYRDESDGGW